MAIRKLAALAALAFVCSGPAQSATVTLCGPQVCYEYDPAQPAIAWFGAPGLLVGTDIVEFLPAEFFAQSASGVAFHQPANQTDTASANFIFDRVYSKSGAEIQLMAVQESGDYEITNDGIVSVDVRLQVTDNVNDTGIGSFPFGPFPETSVDSDPFDASGDSAGQQEWETFASVSPSGDFIDTANDVAVSIQNILTAFTDASGEFARIDKKLVLTVAVVPVPPALLLFASALGAIGWRRRR